MNFLQAHAAMKAFPGGPALKFALSCSAVTATLDLFLRAHAAKLGRGAEFTTLPFNSLAQHIRTTGGSETREVFLLFPWDLLPQADWRTGLPPHSLTQDEALRSVSEHVELLRRKAGTYVFIAAPLPPVMGTLAANRWLDASLLAAVRTLGATELGGECFSLAAYFESGNPFASSALSTIAAAVIQCAAVPPSSAKKVLVTDLDNTMWSGVIGEDGVEGIAYAPEGRGFPFFTYQSLLRKLRNEGVLLAAVSRNDQDLANAPFVRGSMVLGEADFVAVIASYHSKSAQIAQLATDLNLGLDAFVFVDDNPIELEEVRRALPQVEGILFDSRPAELPALLDRLTALFGRAALTKEDLQRTEMYRTRVASSLPSEAKGADLREFLASLDMHLIIRERSVDDFTRCLQLINKTNQFNINGIRYTEEQLREELAQGAHLIGATLDDRNGSHGEVIACLVDAEGMVKSLVMSCRVFQRRAEHAFLVWLAARPYAPKHIRYVATDRNEPVRMFLRETLDSEQDDGLIAFDSAAFATQHAADLALFRLTDA